MNNAPSSRRVLAEWQPYATLLVGHNGAGQYPPAPAKGTETRHFEPWKVVRGITLPIEVVIHATKKWNGELAALIRTWPFAECLKRAGYSVENPRMLRGSCDLSGRKPLPLGALIGVATIVEVVPTTSLLTRWSIHEDGAAERYAEEVKFGDYTAGRFGWVLANARELPEPIPFTGRQDVLYHVGEEIDARIDEQLSRDIAA
jgi:hypothetical protein